MTIDKAIEILTAYDTDYLKRLEPDFDDAVKLGREALKEVKECRKVSVGLVADFLPGETE